MRQFVLDTNVYVDIERDAHLAASGQVFVERHAMLVSSVVVAELLLGVATTARARLLRNLRSQMEISGTLTPNSDDWQTAALAWIALTPRTKERRSFWNDLLLAASCARTATTLITGNSTDFTRIAKHIPLRHERPWHTA